MKGYMCMVNVLFGSLLIIQVYTHVFILTFCITIGIQSSKHDIKPQESWRLLKYYYDIKLNCFLKHFIHFHLVKGYVVKRRVWNIIRLCITQIKGNRVMNESRRRSIILVVGNIVAILKIFFFGKTPNKVKEKTNNSEILRSTHLQTHSHKNIKS